MKKMAAQVRWEGVLCCFVLFIFTVCSEHLHRQCSHRAPRASEVIHHVHLEPHHVMSKRSIDHPLRVFLYYDSSVYKLTKEKIDLIQESVLPQAVHYWERTLMVRQTVAPILLNRRCKTDEVFFRKNDPHPYCQQACETQTLCGEVVVPEEHLDVCRVCDSRGMDCNAVGDKPGKGIYNADFVFYISAMQTDRCHKGTVVAYAAHCQQEAALDRPIAGHANLCPDSISTKSQELETLISTVKHEMLHALGFSVSLYSFFRDKDGNPLTPRGQNGKPPINQVNELHEWSVRVARKIQRPGWKVRGGSITRTVQMMVTPRVVEEVRKHFKCQELEGAELEDQGGEGTVLTHWEKRVFESVEKNIPTSTAIHLNGASEENEAMTGTHTQNPIYSRITLALMEDTGWYMPNYDMAEELAWGRNLGCDFAMKSCKEWIDTKEAYRQPIHPFCKKVKRDPPQTECLEHRRAVALCNLVEYNTDLLPSYQNFDSISGVPENEVGRFGGSVDLADYCPYLQEFTWKSQNVVVRGSQCQYKDNNPKIGQNFALENYGPNSRCFDHGPKMWEERSCSQTRVWQHWGSGCYKCSCSDGRLSIQVLNYTYTCYQANQELHIELYSNGWLHIGTIICPSCEEICSESGMKCLPDEKSLSSASYHQDNLKCNGRNLSPSSFLIGLFILSLTLS